MMRRGLVLLAVAKAVSMATVDWRAERMVQNAYRHRLTARVSGPVTVSAIIIRRLFEQARALPLKPREVEAHCCEENSAQVER